MKQGDAVKMKFVTGAQKRRSESYGRPVDEIGIIVEVCGDVRKVIFPNYGKRIYSMPVSHLGLIACL